MKNILICSSSSNTIDEEYLLLADDISKELSKNYNLVFGASSSGMMGKCMNNFKTIYTYTTKKYEDDLKNITSSEEYILDTTFDRTKQMYQKADVILALPGGSGTYAEIFSIIEENRTTSTPKKLIIYNYKGYYNGLLNIIENLINNNFNNKSTYDYFTVVETKENLFREISK